ncbi:MULTISPECIES: molybdopterin-dependent oxidoreductase [Enterobacterales]|uniref:molybdopterin-dependent oxidoreductase n=1 Tax=Enterobacterales TaxID=91347 RepID=UPI0010C2896C|nr:MULTISPECIES: molybdopterin-dependent oxidoreductase [Enterobacterales]UBH63290.1 molybdopterin-dependent oxidoreductase [Proteus vulgaris]VTP70087.1 dimethyl sulfoxide reductase chain A [Proteus vulgaris]
MRKSELFNLSRRTFVKWSSALSAMAALPMSRGLIAKGVQNSPDVKSDPVWKPAACWHDCGGKCLNKALVSGGTVIRQKTDDLNLDSPETPQQRGCLRGRSQRHQVFGVDRLKYPMRRKNWAPGGGDKTLRGRDQWIRISWDEALNLIADETKRITSTYGQESLWVTGQKDFCPPYYNMFASAGGYTSDWGTRSFGAWSETSGLIGVPWGIWGINDRLDLRNSELIILWGANPAWTSPGSPTYHYIQAKKAGARFICIDPSYTDTAAILDAEWVPVNPATDHALVLGIMYVLLQEDDPNSAPLVNWDFLNRYTTGFDAEHMPEGADPKENFKDYLLGTYTHAPCTPEWASEITGVPVETIKSLARQIGQTRRVALLSGWAPARVNNGEGWVHAFSTLGFMTGHVGSSGNMTGTSVHFFAANGGDFLVNEGPSGLPDIPNPVTTSINHNELNRAITEGKCRQLKGGDKNVNIQMVFHCANNTMQGFNNVTKTIEACRSHIELIVTPAYNYSSNAKYSDLVLPVTTEWEREGIVLHLHNREVLLLGVNITAPLYEAKSDQWIAEQIGKRLGVKVNDIFPVSEKQQFFNQISGATVVDNDGKTRVPLVTITPEDIAKHGIDCKIQQGKVGLEQLLSEGKYQVYRHQGDNYGFIAYSDFIANPEKSPLKTESGKFEIYCGKLSQRAREYGWSDIPAIPAYVKSENGYQSTFDDWDNKKKGNYPFQVYTPHYLRSSHSTLDNVPQLREAWPGHLYMNASDARRLNITHGETVLISSRLGKVLRPVYCTETMKPGVVALPHGRWSDIDENTGIDKAGTENVLFEAVATGLGTSGWNSGYCNVEKWNGEPLTADALLPARFPSLVEEA